MRKFWMAIVIMTMVLGLTGLTGCAKKEAKAPVEEEKIGETEAPIEEEAGQPEVTTGLEQTR
jgi:hypothetical protein